MCKGTLSYSLRMVDLCKVRNPRLVSNQSLTDLIAQADNRFILTKLTPAYSQGIGASPRTWILTDSPEKGSLGGLKLVQFYIKHTKIVIGRSEFPIFGQGFDKFLLGLFEF